jgi:hypothetical protein
VHELDIAGCVSIGSGFTIHGLSFGSLCGLFLAAFAAGIVFKRRGPLIPGGRLPGSEE